MHRFEVKLFEQAHRSPTTPAQIEANRASTRIGADRGWPTTYVEGSHDGARAEAKRKIEAAGFVVRSLSFTADGALSAVVYRAEKGPSSPTRPMRASETIRGR